MGLSRDFMLCPVFTSPASAPQQINSLFLSVTCACARTDLHAHTHTLSHTYKHKHTHTYKHTQTHRLLRTCNNLHTRTCSHDCFYDSFIFSHHGTESSQVLRPLPGTPSLTCQTSCFPMFSNSGLSYSFHCRHSFLQEAFLDI